MPYYVWRWRYKYSCMSSPSLRWWYNFFIHCSISKVTFTPRHVPGRVLRDDTALTINLIATQILVECLLTEAGRGGSVIERAIVRWIPEYPLTKSTSDPEPPVSFRNQNQDASITAAPPRKHSLLSSSPIS